jgi:hypothetical protein
MKFSRLFLVIALPVVWATGLTAQTTYSGGRTSVGSLHLNTSSQYRANPGNLGMAGLPAGPSQVPYPVPRTLANDILVRSRALAAYNASVHPTTNLNKTVNPNRLAQPQKLVDPERFVEKPNSAQRYNFQFSDNQIRSVQAALRRLGVYSGQVDGILGPDTRRAIADYQSKNRQPVTGQPDQSLNASLGIF